MQISDLVGQYNQSVSAGAEKVTGTKGVENLVSSLKSLTKGNIFEGTVSSMKNGRVTLALSNGTSVSARMDGKVSLTEGQSMFFQVKSNDGTTISIRPFVVDGAGVNYTLMQALSAAGLPVQPNFLSMVDKMMEEHMPIDRGSLQQMARLANANGAIDVRTLVQMSKLGIELTPENAAQFENYLGDKQAITAAIDDLIGELPMAMQGSGLSEDALRQMNSQVIAVITEGLEPEAAEGASAAPGRMAEGRNAEPAAAPVVQQAGEEGLTVQNTQSAGEAVVFAGEEGQVVEKNAGAETEFRPAAGTETELPAESFVTGENAGSNPLLQAAAATARGVELVIPAEEGEELSEVTDASGSSEEVQGQQAADAPEEAQGQQAATATGEAQGQQAATAAGEAQEQQAVEKGMPEKAQEQQAEDAPEELREQQPRQETADPLASGAYRPQVTVTSAESAAVTWAAEEPQAGHTLTAVLGQKQFEHLNGMLKELVGQKALSYDGNKDTTDFLKDLRELLDSRLPIDRGSLERLIGSREFKAVVKDALERQWTIRPEELTGSDKINRLYGKLEGQMNRIADVLKATGQENANFTQTAADIRGNVEFMNQINQAYTYIQIPLKMSGQTASGELYVYTNKKALAEGDKELTAFLHLDMEHLGSTDISVKLLNREVSTNFYLEDDAAYELIKAHISVLEERLRAKGYNCKVSVTNENRHVNFVEDFLKKDQPSAGQLHRYSFDMRA